MVPPGRPEPARLLKALVLVLLLVTTSTGGERFRATVLRIADGDTIVVAVKGRETRVRLLGVDAPELGRDGQPGEPYSRAATEFVKARIAQATRIEIEVAGDRVDSYGRSLAFTWLWLPGRPEAVNLSEELLREGLARAIRSYEYPGKAGFLALESEARQKNRRMWRSRNH